MRIANRSRSRARAVATAVALVGAYLVGAIVSGHLSVAARHPLLDGFSGPQPYRWVSPPPNLASSNKPPSSGSLVVRFGPNGSIGGVASTNDLQATLVLSDASFPRASGQTSVKITVVPVDPGTLGRLPAGLTPHGNAYRISAAYQPGGRAAPLAKNADLALVYPATVTAGLTVVQHTILASGDGHRWIRQPTTDAPVAQQATASVHALGYFVVGAPPSVAVEAPAKRSYLPWIIAGIGVLLLIVSSPRLIRWVGRRRGGRAGS